MIFELLGHAHRYVVYRKAQKNNLNKVLYEPPESLSPSEFGYLMRGKFNSDVYVSALIDLSLRGFMYVSLDLDSKKIRLDLHRSLHKKPTRLEASFLKELKREARSNRIEGNPYRHSSHAAFDAVTEQSLIDKGWLYPKETKPLDMVGHAPQWMSMAAWFVMGSIILLLFLGAYLDNVSWLLWLFGIFIAISLLLIVAVFLYVLLRGYMSRFAIGSRLSGRITEKHRKEFVNLKGLAAYLMIGGMDTMTPDYLTLDFDRLDRLYPYAVSLGLDKKIVKMFSRRRY